MLLEFSVKNILSFKEKVTFSLIAATIKEKNEKLIDNIFQIDGKTSLLKTAAIYGANASGKTNIIEALQSFIEYILMKSKSITENENIDILPFILNTENEKKPSEFEILIKDKDTFYQYGVVLTTNEVIKEYLKIKNQRTTIVFDRNENKVYIPFPKKYEKIAELVNKRMIPKNALVVTKAALFNEEIANSFLNCLNGVRTISAINDSFYREFTINQLKNQNIKLKVTDLLKFADDSINGVEVVQFEGESLSVKSNSNETNVQRKKSIFPDIFVSKNIFDESNNIVKSLGFNLNLFESQGTIKLFHLSGPIIDSLLNGYTLFIDELDTSMHPLLIEKIIELFQNPKQNPNNAQLVFTTHNTALLSKDLFRRDQIWLIEKNQYGESDLFSLADFGNIRNDEKIEKNYLIGKYGAIPFLANADDFKVVEESDEKN
ncbi:MAG TPA: ATP-binding protein [Candidatus Kapabacteria bacterium]|nr:ATP-binding protein [Candidatus Kapabacteria bacterium]